MRSIPTALIASLLVASAVVPAAAATGTGQASGESYAGTYVSFEVHERAVTNYTVDGSRIAESVKIQSQSSADSSGLVDVDAGLSSVTHIEGSGLSMESSTETSASVSVEGSASVEAHDNRNGILVVRSGGEPQYAQVNLSAGAEAESQSDSRVTVTTAEGARASFIVVGDGEVTVNDAGNVTASLGEHGALVVRAYPENRTEDDEQQERLIADGQAAGEVHFMAEGGETVVDTVRYGRNTSMEAEQSAENELQVTVDRAESEGTVVIASVSEAVMEAGDGVSVEVDGEAAARASSYSELRGAIGGDRSRYMVVQRSRTGAEASADVLVAVNRFSERTVTMRSSDGGSDGSGDGAGDGDGDTESPGQPGFGAAIALLALVAAAMIAVLRGD